MDSTKGMTLQATAHAARQIVTKGFSVKKVQAVFDSPVKVYPSGKRHPGQYRIVGKGICLVGEPVDSNTFRLITVYQDNVLTPPRPDQLQTPEGRAYAERYNAGLGRSN